MAVTIRTKRSNTAGVVPTGLGLGELAINTADNPPSLFVGDGTNVKRVGNVYVGSTAPANPPIGTIWFNDTTDKVSLWNGSEWIDFSGNYVLKSGDTMTGALNVPANAAGTQVPRVQEVVKKSGDTMTGFLTLNADPTNDLHAASKRYVDNATSNPNLIINGGFDVWQRGTSFTGGGTQYTADHWIGADATRSNIAQGHPFISCVRFDIVANIWQPIELKRTGRLNGVFTVGGVYTVTFWTTGTNNFRVGSLIARDDAKTVSNDIVIATITDPVATGEQFIDGVDTFIQYQQTITILSEVNSTNTCVVMIFAGVQVGDKLTGVKLEEGSVATPWFYEDYSTTLAKCQRYYYTSQRRIAGYGVVGSAALAANISMDMRTVPTGTITTTGTDLNVLSDGIVIQTASNSFIFCNPTATDMLKADRIFTLDAEL